MGRTNPPENRRSALGTACLSSAALALFACQSGEKDSSPGPLTTASADPTVDPDSRVHSMGELGHARDYAMSIDKVLDCPAELGSRKSALAPMGVEVDIQGTSDLEVPANVFYATALDANGDRYAATLTGCEPALSAVLVTRNRTAHGFITFDVPKLSRKLEIRYAPPVIGPGKEELRFSVSR